MATAKELLGKIEWEGVDYFLENYSGMLDDLTPPSDEFAEIVERLTDAQEEYFSLKEDVVSFLENLVEEEDESELEGDEYEY